MAVRKVLNKYFSPDFDHSKLIRGRRPKNKQENVRMMLPMTIRCNTCGNYMYIATKFNMRKETLQNKDYLGCRIYRFYLKCTRCSSEVTFITDPKHHDYLVEHGATRNYEPFKDVEAAEQKLAEKRDLEEDGNAMKFLENKTHDTKRNMDILDALEEIRLDNKRRSQFSVDDLLVKFAKNKEKSNDIN